MGFSFSDDSSLQRWGANLKGSEEGAAEVARLYAEAEAARARYNDTFGKLMAQGENDLPASQRLIADVQSVRQRASVASDADTWKAVAADAGALHGTYRREHETDEERLTAPRNSLGAEKRADVTVASQDT